MITRLDPRCYSQEDLLALERRYTDLLRRTPREAVTTELVDSITTADGGTTWSIKINDGWTFTNGDASAAELEYVPLPAAVKDLVRKQWAGLTDAAGKTVSYK